jgi:hypothetical protein
MPLRGKIAIAGYDLWVTARARAPWLLTGAAPRLIVPSYRSSTWARAVWEPPLRRRVKRSFTDVRSQAEGGGRQRDVGFVAGTIYPA